MVLHQKLIGHPSQAELKDLIRLLEKAREDLTGTIAAVIGTKKSQPSRKED
jgi:hypothetical protein